MGRIGAENVKIGSIVIRCYGFDEIVAFWQEALNYVPRDPAQDGWVVLRDLKGRGPNVSLERVPEFLGRIGKTSRVHLDLYTTDQAGEVERLIGLGATRYPREYRPDDDFVVLEDPDGNRFCVVQVPEKDWAILQRSHLARVRAVGAGLLLVCGGRLARRCRAR